MFSGTWHLAPVWCASPRAFDVSTATLWSSNASANSGERCYARHRCLCCTACRSRLDHSASLRRCSAATDGRRIPSVVDCRSALVRTRSDVRVELADRVLRYEVEERFVNRGASVGEADYLFPLPANAAFQDLKLSINGELVSGETMNAGEARRIYENIVRSQRDPALVEWMGHGLLRARIFPLNPGEEKRIVVRFQSVAPREGDALRVDYFRGARARRDRPSATTARSSFTLSYRPRAGARHAILADAFDRHVTIATAGAKRPCAAMRATSRCSFPYAARRGGVDQHAALSHRGTKTASRSSP